MQLTFLPPHVSSSTPKASSSSTSSSARPKTLPPPGASTAARCSPSPRGSAGHDLSTTQSWEVTPNEQNDAEVEDPPMSGDRLRPSLRRIDHDRPRSARGG